MFRATRAPAWIATASLAGVGLTGCGGAGRSVANCLNGKGFLVDGTAGVVRGSSAGGVNFTLTVYASPATAKRAFAARSAKSTALIGNAVVDFTGNPPPYPRGPPAKLSKAALATIGSCLSHP